MTHLSLGLKTIPINMKYEQKATDFSKKTIQSRTEMNGLFLDTIDYQKHGNKILYTRNDCQGHSQGQQFHASVLSSVTDGAMEYVL